MWVQSLGWASVIGASVLFARSEHPFLGLRYFGIHTFPSPESCDWRSIESPACPPSLAKELLEGTRCGHLQVSQWSHLLQTLIHSLLHPGHFLGGLIKQPASYDSSSTPAHTFTHTHTHTAWCCLVSLSPSLLVILYQLKSQSKEKVRREIACEYATVKNLNIGHMSD